MLKILKPQSLHRCSSAWCLFYLWSLPRSQVQVFSISWFHKFFLYACVLSYALANSFDHLPTCITNLYTIFNRSWRMNTVFTRMAVLHTKPVKIFILGFAFWAYYYRHIHFLLLVSCILIQICPANIAPPIHTINQKISITIIIFLLLKCLYYYKFYFDNID